MNIKFKNYKEITLVFIDLIFVKKPLFSNK